MNLDEGREQEQGKENGEEIKGGGHLESWGNKYGGDRRLLEVKENGNLIQSSVKRFRAEMGIGRATDKAREGERR